MAANQFSSKEHKSSLIFRVVFLVTVIVISLNIEVAFNVEKANPIEKMLLLASAGLLLMTGKLEVSRTGLVAVSYSGAILSALFTSYPDFSWDYFLRGTVSYLAPLLYLVIIPSRPNRDFFLKVVAWMPIIELGIGLIYSAMGIHGLWADDSLGGHRLQGPTVPAFLAAAGATGSFSAVLMADIFEKPKYLLLAAMDVLILLLTAGRMATAVFAIVASATLIWGFRRHARAKIIFLGGAILVGGTLAVLVGGALIERFTTNSLKGRDILWAYLDTFVDRYPYFGVGLGHQYTLMPESIKAATGTFAAHNEYLRLLVETGWLGLTVMMLGLIALLLWIWRSPQVNRNPICLAAFVAFFLFAATDNVLGLPAAFFLLVVAVYGTTRYAPAPAALRPSTVAIFKLPVHTRRGHGPGLPSQSGANK